MLTISYDYIAKDSLRSISYKNLCYTLQEKIDQKIKEFPYESLRKILRKMLEVDMVKRADINQVFEEAKLHIGIFD